MKEAEVFKNNNWEQIEFSQLKKGDRFRTYNPNGELLKNENGYSSFIAVTDAFINEEGLWTINLTHDEAERNNRIEELNNKLALQKLELQILMTKLKGN
jgi:hypothetical protein